MGFSENTNPPILLFCFMLGNVPFFYIMIFSLPQLYFIYLSYQIPVISFCWHFYYGIRFDIEDGWCNGSRTLWEYYPYFQNMWVLIEVIYLQQAVFIQCNIKPFLNTSDICVYSFVFQSLSPIINTHSWCFHVARLIRF